MGELKIEDVYKQSLIDLNRHYLNEVIESGNLKVQLDLANKTIEKLSKSNKNLNEIIINKGRKSQNEKNNSAKPWKFEGKNRKNW